MKALYINVVCPDNHLVFILLFQSETSLSQNPGVQRTALWGLRSRAKQLHWTVTDFTGNRQHTQQSPMHMSE